MRISVAVLLLVVAAGPAHAAPGLARIAQDDRMLLRTDPGARAVILDQMRLAGVDVVRVSVVWRRPRWAAVQGVVNAAHARGLRVLATLTTPAPDRASPRHAGARPGTWRPDPRAFGGFARQTRRRVDADLWSLINEPNSPNHLLPQWRHRRPVSPDLYRALARAGLRGLRGEAVLLGEELAVAHAGRSARSPVGPLRFARAVLNGQGAPLDALGWSVHPYYPTRGPLVRPVDHDTLYPRSLARLLPILDQAYRRGATTRRLDVWDTEDGVQTNPPDHSFGASLAGQARAINEAEWVEWRAPRVRSAAQYLWWDDLAPAGFQSGLFFAGGKAKPSYAAYRLPLVVTRRGRVWTRLPPGVAIAELQGPHGLRRTLRAGADRTATATVAARRGSYRVVAGAARSRKVQVVSASSETTTTGAGRASPRP